MSSSNVKHLVLLIGGVSLLSLVLILLIGYQSLLSHELLSRTHNDFNDKLLWVKKISDPSSITVNKSEVSKEERFKVLALINTFYKDQFTVNSLKYGPAGTIKLSIQQGDQEFSAWLLPDNEHFIFGTIASPYKDLAAQTVASNIPTFESNFQVDINPATHFQAPKTPPQSTIKHASDDQAAAHLENLYSSITSTAEVIKLGNSTKQLYMFVDPNCGVCIRDHDKYVKAALDNNIQINFIPVGAIGRGPEGPKDSILKTSYMLIPEDNSERLKRLNDLTSRSSYFELGLSVNVSGLSSGLKRQTINTELFNRLTKAGTPSMVYLADGKVVTSFLPEDIDGFFRSISSLLD